MSVGPISWTILALIVLFLIGLDFAGHVRNPHPPSLKESLAWTIGYIGLALVFGLIVWVTNGGVYAAEFYAGWVTEWSLSIDNLFVFILILKAFRVPREHQQKALIFGIVIALVLRLVFILAGAALVERFSWIFFLFGLWLLYTAWTQVRGDDEEEEEYHDNAVISVVRRVLPVTDGFIGGRMLFRHGGRTHFTPLFLVVFALGTADLMFAFDSIPAIFGLTHEAFLVFACNAFALMGLRQLFFLVDGLLSKLVYLSYGLAVILAFIGAKLIWHAMHTNSLFFLNGGEPIHWGPEIGTATSLIVIIGVLTITILASLWKSSRTPQRASNEKND